MAQEETERPVERFHRDAAGVVWRITLRLARLGGRWEVTSVRLDSSHDRGRLTATVLRGLERDLVRVRGEFNDFDGDPAAVVPRDDLGNQADSEWMGEPSDAALREEWERGPVEPASVPAVLTGRPGPRPDDERWAARVEVMAAAWAAGLPMVQALRELEPGASEATYSARVTRARKWAREHGDPRLDGVGRGRA